MVKTWPKEQDHREPIARISQPAMEWKEVNLNELLACCRRELAFRQRYYPKMVARGSMKQEKADKETELMRECCDYLVDAIFKCVIERREAVAKINPGQAKAELGRDEGIAERRG